MIIDETTDLFILWSALKDAVYKKDSEVAKKIIARIRKIEGQQKIKIYERNEDATNFTDSDYKRK